MSSGAIRVQTTLEDYLAANILHWRWTRQILLLVIGAIVVGAIPYFSHGVVYFESDVLEPVVGYSVFVILLLIGCRYILIPLRTRRVYYQLKFLQHPQDFSWDETGTQVRGEGFSAQTPWLDYLKWRENKQIFTIYLSDLQFRIFPKRAFPDDKSVDDFRDLLRRKITPKQGAKRAKMA